MKGFAYAGPELYVISAFIAHSSSGHPVSEAVVPLVFPILLAVSYI